MIPTRRDGGTYTVAEGMAARLRLYGMCAPAHRCNACARDLAEVERLVELDANRPPDESVREMRDRLEAVREMQVEMAQFSTDLLEAETRLEQLLSDARDVRRVIEEGPPPGASGSRYFPPGRSLVMRRLLAILVVFGVAALPQVAHAQPPTVATADPFAEYRVVDVEQGEEGWAEPMPGPATSDADSLAGPRSGFCEYRHVWYRGFNALHKWLWTFHQELRYCHTGYGPSPGPPVIMLNPAGHGPSVSNWGTIAGWASIIWEYDGVVGSRNAGGVGDTYVSRWREGKFKGCIIRIGICQTKLPWLLEVGHGDGTTRVDGGM